MLPHITIIDTVLLNTICHTNCHRTPRDTSKVPSLKRTSWSGRWQGTSPMCVSSRLCFSVSVQEIVHQLTNYRFGAFALLSCAVSVLKRLGPEARTWLNLVGAQGLLAACPGLYIARVGEAQARQGGAGQDRAFVNWQSPMFSYLFFFTTCSLTACPPQLHPHHLHTLAACRICPFAARWMLTLHRGGPWRRWGAVWL